jgi:hypothetical protein
MFCGRARADIREVLAHPHFSEKHLPLKNVIARRTAAVTPPSLDIGPGIIGAYLFAVAIDAAVCHVNARAAFEHSRLRLRIDVGAFLVGLRIEMPDLPIRNHGQSHP